MPLFRVSRFFFVAAAILACWSCSTDIQLNAPYKDTPVVFGLLDIADSAHFIRINKGFLGNISAEELAKNPDSINYAPGTFDVSMEAWEGKTLKQTIILTETTERVKKEGLFATDNYVLFKTTEAINKDYTYKLYIKNKNTGKEITGETRITAGCLLEGLFISPIAFLSLANNVQEYQELTFKWTSGANARRYQLYLDFYYRDIPFSGTDTIQRKVRIYCGEQFALEDDVSKGGRPLEKKFNGETFYKKIAESVKYDPNVKFREIGRCIFYAYAAAEELSVYMDVSKPSNSINQEKPDYTNLTNAFGIFSSRNTTIRQDVRLNQYSTKMFGFSEHTQNLNFCDPEPNPQTTACN